MILPPNHSAVLVPASPGWALGVECFPAPEALHLNPPPSVHPQTSSFPSPIILLWDGRENFPPPPRRRSRQVHCFGGGKARAASVGGDCQNRLRRNLNQESARRS